MLRTLRIISTATLLLSTPVHAQIPAIDWVKLIAELQKTMADKLRAEVDFERQKTMMDHEATTTGNEIDAFNNAIANAALRMTSAKTDIYTERLKSELLPSATSCQQAQLSYDVDKILCSAATQLLNLDQAASAIGNPILRNTKRGSGQVNDVGSAYGYEDSDGDGVVEQEEIDEASTIRALDKGITVYESATKLFSNGEAFLTLSPEDQQAAKDLVVLLAPPYEGMDPTEAKTPEQKEFFVEQSRREAVRSTVFHLYNTALAYKTSINPEAYAPSPYHYYRKQADVFYGDEEYEETVAFKASTDMVSSPTQLYRYIVTSKALQVDMSLKAYEQKLKDLNVQVQKLQAKLPGN